MTDRLRIVLLICLFLYFAVIIRLLRKKDLLLKYCLLWLLVGVLMVVLVLLPDLLILLCHFVGIVGGMNGLFTFALGFVFALLLSFTVIVSRQSNKIKTLIQTTALLEKRIRELEEVE